MNRKSFLKFGGVSAATVALTPLATVNASNNLEIIKPNSGAITDLNLLTDEMAGKSVYDIVGAKNRPALEFPWAAIGKVLGGIALDVGAGIVTDKVTEWINSLNPDKRKEAENAHSQQMNAYKNENPNVFGKDTNQYITNYYGIMHPNGLDMRSLFFSAIPTSTGFIYSPVIADGPVLTAIRAAARDWQHPYISKADGLLPLGAYRAADAWFYYSTPYEYIYYTGAGFLHVYYLFDAYNWVGNLMVGSSVYNQQTGRIELIFRKDYVVQFS